MTLSMPRAMQLPYLGFLWQLLQASGGHPLIFMDLPHVALRPFRRAQSVDVIAAATTKILRQRGFSQACFVGHSFGTFCVSRVCQLFPETVDSIVRPASTPWPTVLYLIRRPAIQLSYLVNEAATCLQAMVDRSLPHQATNDTALLSFNQSCYMCSP